jgi:hypothetical protein
MWAVVWSRRKDMASWIGCHNEAFLRLDGVLSPALKKSGTLAL